MEKIGIILWNIWTHRNHVVFRNSKPNPLLIIEKATLTFQNLYEFMNESCFDSEECDITQRVEKWIRWISPINGRFKLNFDGSRINNISASGWVIRDTNETIKMAGSKHLGNASIIIVKCETLRDEILDARLNSFFNLEIEGNSKVIIDCYNKKISYLVQLFF